MPVNSTSEIVGFDAAVAAALGSHGHAIADTTGLQAALDGKQAAGSYAAATHGHAIADVTGLQTALDGKQASGSYATASHNHDGTYATANHTHTGLVGSTAITTTGGGIGYATGAGGTVTQATNKATAVTLNKLTGNITMNAAALAAGAVVTFVLNNSTIAAEDQIIVTHHSAGTIGPYLLNGRATGAGTASIAVRNTSAASLSEAIVIKVTVIKAVNA